MSGEADDPRKLKTESKAQKPENHSFGDARASLPFRSSGAEGQNGRKARISP
jgi:hypothetical protein